MSKINKPLAKTELYVQFLFWQLNGNLYISNGTPQNLTVVDLGPLKLDHEANEEDCKATDNTLRSRSGPKSVKRGLKYWLRHPYLRILTAYLVVFCNFLIFAEDPVSHSHTDSVIDIIGNIYAFVFSR